jgi:hypothetical protein
MKAMLVEVNGKRVCLAALTGKGNVHASMRWMREDDLDVAILSVLGIDAGEGAIWPIPPIDVGDEVRIKVVETEKGDPPLKLSTMVSPATRK